MQPLPTLIAAWAAVYGYVCLYACLLYAQRRRDREYLTYGLWAGSVALYAVGQIYFVQAETLPEAAQAVRAGWVAIVVAAAFFIDFCHSLAGVRSHARTAGYLWAAVGLVGVLSGVFVTEDRYAPSPTWGFAWAPDFAEPGTTTLGHFYIVATLALLAYAVARMVPVARHDRDVKGVLAASTIGVLAGTHDFLIRYVQLRSFYLVEHVALVLVGAMSYLMLDRFVRTTEQLSLRTEELRQSYDELRNTQRELVNKEQLAAIGELSAVIAHEVRNPLAVIKNAVSGLRRKSLQSGDQDTLLKILDEETERLTRLVHDLLAYAQPATPKPGTVDVEELSRSAVELVRDTEPPGVERAHELDVELDLAPGHIRGDRELLRQALTNIVDNAVQAMPGGGTLRVSTCPCEVDGMAGIRFCIEDTGEGMESRICAKARNPFFTTRPAGTGLGLAIVDRVARIHGGYVDIRSERGAGTSVYLVVPTQPPELGGDMPKIRSQLQAEPVYEGG